MLAIRYDDRSRRQASRIWDLGAVNNLKGSYTADDCAVSVGNKCGVRCAWRCGMGAACIRVGFVMTSMGVLSPPPSHTNPHTQTHTLGCRTHASANASSRQSPGVSPPLFGALQAQATLWENVLLWKKKHPNETDPKASEAGAGDAKAKKLPPARPKPPPARPPPPMVSRPDRRNNNNKTPRATVAAVPAFVGHHWPCIGNLRSPSHLSHPTCIALNPHPRKKHEALSTKSLAVPDVPDVLFIYIII